jgi:hypothetical protein
MAIFINTGDPFEDYYNADTLRFLRVHMLNQTMDDETVGGFQRDRGKNGKPIARMRNRVKALGPEDEFDPRVFTPRIVSERDDGTYFTIDGNGSNHWVEDLFGADTKVPCVVLTSLTRPEEADLFEKAQRGRLVTKAVQFAAAVEAERVDALEITEILGDFGGEIGTGRKAGNFGQSAITYTYDKFGAKHLRQVILFIKQNFWDDPHSTNVGFVKALADLLGMKGYEAAKLSKALTGTQVATLLDGASGGGAQTNALRGMKDKYHALYGDPNENVLDNLPDETPVPLPA